jgi:hypothetical protein
MTRQLSLEVALLAGAQELLAAHASELPQRDDLCGAFCAALALQAAGIRKRDGEPLDQDRAALAAGSVVSTNRASETLPQGEVGRRDYRLELPTIDDPDVSGTTAGGVLDAIAALSDGRLAAIPYTGPWRPDTLGGLFDAVATLERPASLIANLATRHLWGGRARAEQLLAYLFYGELDGPPADWDVGHFVSIFARLQASGGTMYAIADTYPALGHAGVHLQPQERLAVALEREGMSAGGMLVVVEAQDAAGVRSRAEQLGMREGIWDNGTITSEQLA